MLLSQAQHGVWVDVHTCFRPLYRLPFVGGWCFAMVQYSSLCEGAVVNSLDAVAIGEEVLVRVQVG